MKRIELGISFFQKSTEQNHGCTWHANCRTMAQDGLHAGLYPLASSAPHRFVRRGKSFFFSNVSASPLQCISGMWNAPVLRRGFICLSNCCGTILNNGSLRLMRFRIHGSMRTHCQLAWCRMIPSPKHPPRHEPGSHACKFHSTARHVKSVSGEICVLRRKLVMNKQKLSRSVLIFVPPQQLVWF